MQGCIFFNYGLLVGWGKNYVDLLRKNAKLRGGKTGEKRKFSLYLGGKISLWKKGVGGENVNYLDNIHPCGKMKMKMFSS